MKTLQWCLDRVGKEPVYMFCEHNGDGVKRIIPDEVFARNMFESQHEWTILDGQEAIDYNNNWIWNNPHPQLGRIKPLQWHIDRIGKLIECVTIDERGCYTTIGRECIDEADAKKMFEWQEGEGGVSIYREEKCTAVLYLDSFAYSFVLGQPSVKSEKRKKEIEEWVKNNPPPYPMPTIQLSEEFKARLNNSNGS